MPGPDPRSAHPRCAPGVASAHATLGVLLLAVGLAGAAAGAAAATAPAAPAAAGVLPPEVRAEFQRARIPLEALALVIEPVDLADDDDAAPGTAAPVIHNRPARPSAQRATLPRRGDGFGGVQLNERKPMNPASLMKLLTTAAALDRLGPAYSWRTPVWFGGPLLEGGVLDGALHIQGQGDPSLTLERTWLLLRRVQALGVREIRGDIVLDAGVLAPDEADPGEFDGEPLRPYNVRPQPLLLAQHALIYTFIPDTAAGVARVSVLPALDGSDVQTTVALAPGPCGDWRRGLQGSFGADGRVRFAGRYPVGCGELNWPVADPQPASYNARLLRRLWAEMGGTLSGTVREGLPPEGPPRLEFRSPPLAEVVRDINKFSNNVMAQQLFLTLGAQARPGVPADAEAGRAALAQWLQEGLGEELLRDGVVVDNGSGLSRRNRVTALALARVLRRAYDSPWMPELMSSLPVTGLDGTLRRSRATPGRAHLKTGSLRDVAGLAGYVLGASGRRYVFVALIQHPAAGGGASRPALDALVQWTLRDLSAR